MTTPDTPFRPEDDATAAELRRLVDDLSSPWPDGASPAERSSSGSASGGPA